MKEGRIAILWDYYQHYHFARLRVLTEQGRLHGWEVVGLAAGRGGAARDSHAIEETTDTGLTYLSEADDLYSPAVAQRFAEKLDELQPNVAIIPGYGTATARAGLKWCRLRRRGAVMIFESQESDRPRRWYKEWLKRRLVQQADTVFCGGVAHARYAAKLGMPRERIFFGYSAVDNDHWRLATAAARTAAPPPLGAPYFLAIGRFIPKKNFVGLVTAFANFKATRGDWHLVIVGDGPQREAIVAEINRQGLQASVHVPGYAPAAETARWLAHAGAFVMPSHREEQWGLVVNEALAAGVPAIVSRICGCAEDLIQHETTGLLFDPADTHALSAAMNRIASDSELRSRLGRAGYERVQNYSLARFAKEALAASKLALAVAQNR